MILLRSQDDPQPLEFRGYDCVVSTRKLPAGDYSLYGFEGDVAILRRSQKELIAGLTHRRQEFAEALDRMRGCTSAAVVVESPLRDILDGRGLNGLTREQAEQAIIAVSAKYRMPFLYGESRSDAERLIFNFLRHLQSYAVVRYNCLVKSVHATPESMLDETGKAMLREQNSREQAAAAARLEKQIQRNREAEEIAQGIAPNPASEPPKQPEGNVSNNGAEERARELVARMTGRK